MAILDTLKQYRKIEALFIPLAQNVAVNALNQNWSQLEKTVEYANQLSDLVQQYKDESVKLSVNRDPNIEKTLSAAVDGDKKMAKLASDALLLSKHGTKMTDKGTN